MQRAKTGDYVIERGQTETIRDKALALRAECFRDGREDSDAFDGAADHVVISKEDVGPLAAFRILVFPNGTEAHSGYSAQFYDLANLSGVHQHCLEVGRFCTQPEHPDPNLIRLAWGAISGAVQDYNAELLFGCSSFAGNAPETINDALVLLRDEYLAPEALAPRRKAKETCELADLNGIADRRMALMQMPPLLKTYLRMGGWVSDHAVIDRDLGTMHVFTGVEVARIPAARRSSVMKDARR